MSFVKISYALTFLIICFLGLAIFKNNPKSKINLSFTILILAAGFWTFCLFIADTSKAYGTVLFWSKMALAGPSWIPALFLYFSQIFPISNKYKEHLNIWRFLYLIFPPFIISFLAPLDGLGVQNVRVEWWGASVTPGPLYFWFLAYFIAYMVLGFANLFKAYRIARNFEKTQIKLIFVGILISAVLTVFTNVVLVILGYSQLGIFGPASLLFFLGFTAYAIVETRLFDIRVITTEVLVALISLGLLVDALLSKTLLEGGLKGILFVLVSYGSYKLVQSVKEEIRRRQEIQKLTTKLKKANVRLQELDRMKSEFLSVASHELNSPMSIIKGYLHMILWEGFGKVDKNARTYLERVYMKTDQLAKLVADLLNVSRIEQGRIQLDIKPVDIQPILKDICEDHAIKAKEKGLTFTLSTPSSSKKRYNFVLKIGGIWTFFFSNNFQPAVMDLLDRTVSAF